MSTLRRVILSIALVAGLVPAIAFAAAPPPVPALPDTERRTTYSISGTTCACAVNFAIYGDTTDVDNWVEVWLGGTRYLSTDPTFGWVLSSPTGSIGTIPRPITDAIITFNSVQTGTVQIVGARRPRRLTQFNENRGVAARDLNQAFTDVIAQMRETWDKTNDVTGRAILGLPGETIALLPSAASRASSFICWDPTGLIPLACAPGLGQGNVVGPNSSTNGHIALFSGTTGRILVDGGTPGTGTVTGPVSSTNGGFARWNGTTGLVLQDGPAVIPIANGGTNNNLTPSNGGLAYSDSAGIQILAGTATANQIPMSGSSSAPAWSTATYPSTVTANTLLYGSGTNVIGGLATANNGVLITSGAGVPSISSTLPSAVQGNITSVGTVTSGVWNGTQITGSFIAPNTVTNSNLSPVSNNTIKSNISGGSTNDSDNTLTAILDSTLGTTQGSIIYRNATQWTLLAPGTNGQFLLSGGAAANPSWGAGGAGSGTVTSVTCSGLAITAAGTCPEVFGFENCSIAASVGSSLLTVALKDNTGADPSSTSPCRIAFRNSTAATGSWVLDSVTAPLSMSTFATGATLGSSSNTAFRFWVVAFDNGGTVALSLINCLTSAGVQPINEGVVQSSTAISGSATSAGVFYTANGTTLSNKAIKILGYIEYNSTGLATAGTYASGPNFIQTFGPSIKKPGDLVQRVIASTSTTTNVTSTTKTATQLTASVTPTSAANQIRVEASGTAAITSSAQNAFVQISRGSGPTLIGSLISFFFQTASVCITPVNLLAYDIPNTASSQAYTVYLWNQGTGSSNFPASSAQAGVSVPAYMTIEEYMG